MANQTAINLTSAECLAEIRPKCAALMAEVQAMLEGYPMDTRTFGDLRCIVFRLKLILEH